MRNTVIKHNTFQLGLSLIELMIAMLVGLILIGGVLSIFISSRQSYGINSAVARIQENARFALNFISRPTRMAGYMGCGLSNSNFANDLKSNALPFDFTNGIVGFEYTGTGPGNNYNIPSENPTPVVGTGNWSPALDASLQNLVIPGTDVLVLRYTHITNTAGYVDNSPSPPSGAQFWLTANPGIQAGDILVISNCVNTVVVQATQVNGAGNNHIVVNIGNTYQPGNSVAGIPPTMVGANVASVGSEVLYIGKGADGSPALFEADTDASQANGFLSQELVPGVENMQLLYGVDTTGSQVPSQYVTANNVANWNTVVSVRVALLLRSDTGAVPLPKTAPKFTLDDATVYTPLDTRLRQVFTATIALRNRLP
ncbi:MAG: PilW family protein [Gammaproteobacteria bacterium]|nr:PilW family protein [Gammaproteobacteria bacterium]